MRFCEQISAHHFIWVCVGGSEAGNVNIFADQPKPPPCFHISQHSAFLMTKIEPPGARAKAAL